MNEASKNEIRIPLFEAPDGKIMATGDMFRGPYTGIFSEIDLNNPGNKLSKEEEKFD
ncbi:hypothetical protein [Cytobacillus firmus]|uniref:hypothetical protein n=1 Tax=Cytobacillus firmus TaxID=1399 RepID=UPI0022283A67|nr:hypothetical protein [Cytobacillus firmus]